MIKQSESEPKIFKKVVKFKKYIEVYNIHKWLKVVIMKNKKLLQSKLKNKFGIQATTY